jgi:3-deoxy-D-manno-octulosonic-acid transferase
VHVLIDLAYLLIAITVAPFWYLRRRLARKVVAPLRERLGGFPRSGRDERILWIHGVSVGEIRAARGLVETCEREQPERRIVLSVTTQAGFDIARREYPGRTVFYSPLDFSWVVRQAFDQVRPEALVLMELELWPNLLREAAARAVPVIVANAKMSKRSARGYRRLLKVLPRFLDPVAVFCLQHESFLPRFAALGVPEERTPVTGVMKVDNLPAGGDADLRRRRRAELGLQTGDFLFVAASTHAGEETAVFDAYRVLRREFGRLRLALAPRHVTRAAQIEAEAAACGLRTVRKSSGQSAPDADTVLVIDTMGELDAFFAAADVVFVGGSLVPVGGHNILEPAAWGVPVIFGPHTWTVSFFAEEVIEQHAGRRVDGAAGLADAVGSFVRDACAKEDAGRRARGVIDRNRGATRRTVDAIDDVLAARGAQGSPTAIGTRDGRGA